MPLIDSWCSAAVDTFSIGDDTHFAIDTGRGEFHLINWRNQNLNVAAQYHPRPSGFKDGLPVGIRFGEDGNIVVAGSSNGYIFIFDRASGKLVGRLHQGGDGMVAVVAVSI